VPSAGRATSAPQTSPALALHTHRVLGRCVMTLICCGVGGWLACGWVRCRRWDSEQVKQVWAQCSDVEIIAGASDQSSHAVQYDEEPELPPLPPQTTRPTDVCVGESLGLASGECAAWVELYDALNGRGCTRRQPACPRPD
jgi:hypothetical protein